MYSEANRSASNRRFLILSTRIFHDFTQALTFFLALGIPDYWQYPIHSGIFLLEEERALVRRNIREFVMRSTPGTQVPSVPRDASRHLNNNAKLYCRVVGAGYHRRTSTLSAFRSKIERGARTFRGTFMRCDEMQKCTKRVRTAKKKREKFPGLFRTLESLYTGVLHNKSNKSYAAHNKNPNFTHSALWGLIYDNNFDESMFVQIYFFEI